MTDDLGHGQTRIQSQALIRMKTEAESYKKSLEALEVDHQARIRGIREKAQADQTIDLQNSPYLQLKKSLQDQIETFGMSDRKSQVLAMNKADLIPKGKFDEMFGLAKQLDEMDAAKKKSDEFKKSQEEVTAAMADLQKEARQFGMDEFQKKLDDLSSKGLLNKGQLKEAQETVKHLQDMKKHAEELKDVEIFKDSLPMDKFKKITEQLKEWRKEQRITLDEFQDGMARAEHAAFGDVKLPPLIKAGSAEAQAMRYAAGSSPGVPKFSDPILQRDPGTSFLGRSADENKQALKECTKALSDLMYEIRAMNMMPDQVVNLVGF
jgi:soluble cytochrome b562